MKTLISLLLLLLLFGCSGERKAESGTKRYVITSPEVGEIVYLLEGSGNIVGVIEEVDYPHILTTLPKVGNFGAVSREKVIALNPTLVFTTGLEQQLLAYELTKLGISTLSIYPKSLNEMLEGVKSIAIQLGIEERGVLVADSLQQEIDSNRWQSSNPPRVYVEIYGNPIMSVSRSSFIGELLDVAGGDNIFKELPRDYSRIRVEDVILADPEIIILTYPGITATDVSSRKGWQNISACLNGRIYTVEDIDPDLLLRAGPRSIEGIKLLQKFLHQL